MCGTRQDAALQIEGAINNGVSPSREGRHLHSDTGVPHDADRNAAGHDIVLRYSFRSSPVSLIGCGKTVLARENFDGPHV